MVLQSAPRVTPAEYLAADRAAPRKSEYLDGEVLAMGGASERLNLIVTNVVAELHRQLKGRPCRVYPSDMRVRIKETGLYAYPDVTVVCGRAEFDDEQRDTLLNPTLIVEVLSKSTESHDRGENCAHYRKLASLAVREINLVVHSGKLEGAPNRRQLEETASGRDLDSVWC